MTLADIPIRSLSNSRQEHLNDHNRFGVHSNQTVYSADYATLQEAIDDAILKQRSLIIEPKQHNLSAPLLLDGLTFGHVYAYGAHFVSAGSIATMLDMRDCIYSSWNGGRFTVQAGHVVDKAIYLREEANRVTMIAINDIFVEGHYTIGMRIGKPGSNLQCDHIYVTNASFTGEENVGQVGLHIGTGVYGNCLNHNFTNLTSASHEINFYLDQTNAYIVGGYFGHAPLDFYLAATVFTLRNSRCESSERFIESSGLSGYLTHVTIEDISWTGENLAIDGEWIRYYHSGNLRLNNVQITNPANPPVIKADAGSKLLISLDGLAVPATFANAFDVTANVTIKGHYLEDDPVLGILSITTV